MWANVSLVNEMPFDPAKCTAPTGSPPSGVTRVCDGTYPSEEDGNVHDVCEKVRPMNAWLVRLCPARIVSVTPTNAFDGGV